MQKRQTLMRATCSRMRRSLQRQEQLFVELADFRIEQTKCRGQPRGMHFQRRKHLAELLTREVIRELHHQPLWAFRWGEEMCPISPFPSLGLPFFVPPFDSTSCPGDDNQLFHNGHR